LTAWRVTSTPLKFLLEAVHETGFLRADKGPKKYPQKKSWGVSRKMRTPNPHLLSPDPTGTGTIALDPTFGSFTLLELVSWVKVFRLFRSEQIVLLFRVWTQ